MGKAWSEQVLRNAQRFAWRKGFDIHFSEDPEENEQNEEVVLGNWI